MKTLLVVVLLLITNSVFAQFQLSGAVGYGIRVNNEQDYDLFQSSVTVEPQYDFGKLKVSAVALAINDVSADFYAGIRPAYEVYNTEEMSFSISVSALQGLEGKSLLGGGLVYDYMNMFVNADAYHEPKLNQFIGNLSFGVYLLR